MRNWKRIELVLGSKGWHRLDSYKQRPWKRVELWSNAERESLFMYFEHFSWGLPDCCRLDFGAGAQRGLSFRDYIYDDTSDEKLRALLAKWRTLATRYYQGVAHIKGTLNNNSKPLPDSVQEAINDEFFDLF
jgi:hypothetical protein